jgi:hypothetical protein
MPDPAEPATPGAADRPTRLQRAVRRGCAGLAYTIVLVPLVVVIWFFSSIPRGWEQFGDLVWKIVSEKPPGADTEIVVFNYSGHDVSGFVIRYADQEVRYNSLLETYREADTDQNIRHYKRMFWRPIRPTTFRLGITYTEVDTGATRSGSFTADRRPRPMCRFVFVLEADGPVLSECQRPEVEGFSSS